MELEILLEALINNNLCRVPELVEKIENTMGDSISTLLSQDPDNLKMAEILGEIFIKISHDPDYRGKNKEFLKYILKITRILLRDGKFANFGAFITTIPILAEEEALEALKVFYNLYSQCPNAREVDVKEMVWIFLIKNIQYSQNEEVVDMSLKTLFLTTAFSTSAKTQLIKLGIWDVVLDKLSSNISSEESSNRDRYNEKVKLCLRIVYNLEAMMSSEPNVNEVYLAFEKLASFVSLLLLQCEENYDKNYQLITCVFALFFNCNDDFFKRWIDIFMDKQPTHMDSVFFMEKNVIIFDKMLKIVDTFLKNYQEIVKRNDLMIILQCLIKLVSHRIIRKFFRSVILPPLRVEIVLPEGLDSIKGRMIRLMTSVSSEIKFLSAQLLFKLCKENPTALVMNTGFGNAFGFLSDMGLLNEASYTPDDTYSSDNETMTEEYESIMNKIDFVTGIVKNNKD